MYSNHMVGMSCWRSYRRDGSCGRHHHHQAWRRYCQADCLDDKGTPGSHDDMNSLTRNKRPAKLGAQKRASALQLLNQLSEVGLSGSSNCPAIAAQCVVEALRLYDDNVLQCFVECTSVDTPDNAWQQAQLSLSRGGLRLSYHSSAAYIASLTASDSGSNTNHDLLPSLQHYTVPLFHLLRPFHWKQFWSYQATKKICPADLKNSIFVSA
ncbi:hypothetical protein EMCRGX_G009762 [Ephydatia muelleri]